MLSLITSIRKTNKYAGLLIISLLVFTLSAIVAARQTIVGLERNIFDFVYGWGTIIRPFFWAITQLGSAWFFVATVIIIWWQGKRKLATNLVLGGVLAYTFVEIAKVLVGRPRPYFLISGVVPRESFVGGQGFPSGHTALITVMALCVLQYIPKKYRWIPWLGVAAVGLSRIYLGVHAPLDVVGGFAIGLMVVCAIRFIQLKLDLRRIAYSQGELARAKTVLSERKVSVDTLKEEKLFAVEISRPEDEGVIG